MRSVGVYSEKAAGVCGGVVGFDCLIGGLNSAEFQSIKLLVKQQK